MGGEHAIPFRTSEVVAMCADELGESERDSFRGFTRMLSSLLHHRFHAHIEALKDAYHTTTDERLTAADRKAARQRLEQELTALAVAANFTRIEEAELARAFTEHALLKVRMTVDTDDLEKIIFFRRGQSSRTVRVATWFGLRRKPVTFANYSRVLVYAAFKDEEHFADRDLDELPFRPGSTIVKLFQDVPRDDLEMIYPNVRVRMRLLDKMLIGVPALFSGVAIIATKLIASIGLLLLLFAFWTGMSDRPVELSQAKLVTIGAGLAAFGGFLWRQVTKFKNRKIRFMKALSENLYFRNLGNDAGVFHHLLDAAEEAEVTEAVLAYHFLRTAPHPLTPADLDQLVEAWFVRHSDIPVDFEVHDGLRKLRELCLVTEPEDGRLTAVDLDEAKRRMDRVWDDIFDFATPAQRPLSASGAA